ncbi:MAG: hypothetical protein C4308_00520 [Chitinophagaceae bacterium]
MPVVLAESANENDTCLRHSFTANKNMPANWHVVRRLKHMALRIVRDEKELKAEAKKAEAKKDFGKAADLYKQLIRQDPLDESAYNRLMIVLRKQKNYEEELKTINKAIKLFELLLDKKRNRIAAKHKQLVQLSNALIKKAGLKKTNEEYLPEPIASW